MGAYRADRLRRAILPLAAAYGCWLVTGTLGLAALSAWRAALLALYVALGFNRWGRTAFNDIVVIALLLAWLVLVVATEGWYRQAAARGALGRRFARMTAALLALLATGWLTQRLV